MSTLLETLLSFVGVMFVLALAAQSVQELLKAAFTIKGQTLRKAVESLIRESVRAQGQWSIDADAILAELTRRLGALGQKGFRKGSLRLDALPAGKLKELLAGIDPGLVPGLPVDRPVAKDVLAAIAAQAERWYDLALAPVDDRYRRRMRALALVASAIVVIPLNAGARKVYDASRNDPEFRARVAEVVARLDSIPDRRPGGDTTAAAAPDTSAAAPGDTTAALRDTVAAAADTAAPAGQTLRSRISPRDSAAVVALYNREDPLLRFGLPTRADLGSPGWWLSILVSILFVSLGAPFWHDLLETVFGLKNRLRGPSVPEAKKAQDEG